MVSTNVQHLKGKGWSDSKRKLAKIIHDQGMGRGILEIDVFGRYILVIERRRGWEIVALVDAKDTDKPAQLYDLRQYVGFDEVDDYKYIKQGFELIISHSEQEDSDGNKLIQQEIARIEVLTEYAMLKDSPPKQAPSAIIIRKDLEHIERKTAKPRELGERKVFAQV